MILLQPAATTKHEISDDAWQLGRRVGFRIFPVVACARLDGRRSIRFAELIPAAGLTSKRKSVAIEVLGLAFAWLRVLDLVSTDFVVVD